MEEDKMVIFVTVGTERFDDLIKKIDELVGEGKINEKVIMQIGNGEYIPKNCEYFRYAESLKLYREKVNLVIGHGGLASILESIMEHKKYIGVANTEWVDNHQKEILKKMSDENYILWCKNLETLDEYISKAKKFGLRKYIPPRSEISKKINNFLLDKKDDGHTKKFLIILGEGGHTFHMVKLVEMLGDNYTYDYMILKRDKISEKKIVRKGKIFKVGEPYHGSKIRTVHQRIKCFIETFIILIKSRHDAIISCGGGGITLPVFFLGKLMGKKTIFIEDMCRVYSKSMSGKIIEKLYLANLFFVQWGSMKKLYPKAIYVGRLF